MCLLINKLYFLEKLIWNYLKYMKELLKNKEVKVDGWQMYVEIEVNCFKEITMKKFI